MVKLKTLGVMISPKSSKELTSQTDSSIVDKLLQSSHDDLHSTMKPHHDSRRSLYEIMKPKVNWMMQKAGQS